MNGFNITKALLVAMLASQSAHVFGAEKDLSTRSDAGQSLVAPEVATGSQPLPVSQIICVSYAYDKNGNRTAVITDTPTTQQPKWGTNTFPCFIWNAN